MATLDANTVQSTAHKASKAARSGAETVKRRGDDMSTQLADLTDKGFVMAKHQAQHLMAQAEDLVGVTTKSIRRHPWTAVAVATGIGILAAGLTGLALRAFDRRSQPLTKRLMSRLPI